MKRVLFVGNSQAACIKLAFDAQPELMEGFDVSFCVIPGGTGPWLTLADRKLKVIREAPGLPARFHPLAVKNTPIDSYDVVVVGGLIYYTGCKWNRALPSSLLHRYAPKANKYTSTLTSKALCKEIFFAAFSELLGFKFLRILRANFTGPIIVHPFPVPSETLKANPDWIINVMYHDSLGAHAFFLDLHDEFLEQECRRNNAILLPYPRPEWREALYAPADEMAPDGLHPFPAYGAMILRQVAETLKNL